MVIPEVLVPDAVTLIPVGPDAAVTFGLGAIEAQLAQIPEDLDGIDPEFVLGEYDDGQKSIAAIGVVFDNVLSLPVGRPFGAGTELLEPMPTRVVALYDAFTSHELGVWVFGCGSAGERCAR